MQNLRNKFSYSQTKICLTFLLPLLFIPVLSAQKTFPVNLETVLKLSGANNLTIQEYKLKHQEAIAKQSKAKEWWLPSIYAGATTHYLNGAAMNTDGRIFTNLDRNNIWSGFGISAEIDFGKGIYKKLAAKQLVEAANYFSLAEKNKIILQSVETYFDLQSEQLKYVALQNLVNQADLMSQQIKIQVDVGLRYQSEYLLANSNFNHLKFEMLQTKIEWQKKSATLSSLLNLSEDIRLISADTTLVPTFLSLEKTNTMDYTKRFEYMALNAELKSIELERKTINQGLLLPKLKISTDDGIFGAYSKELFNTYQINASLLWNLPLGRLSYKGDLKRYNVQILIQQNEIEQFKNQYQKEMSTAIFQLQSTEEQIAIAKKALQSSTEALNQSIERQKLGTAKPFEVFQAQQFYLQAQIDYLKAVSEYNKAQFSLKVAKGESL